MTPLRKPLTAFLLLACLAALSPPYPAHADGIAWRGYAEGRVVARAENKKVFLYFHAEWCRYCALMASKTFKDTAVVDYLNQHFIAVQVDADREPEIVARYNVRPLPDVWFLTPEGEAISNRPGYIDPELMLKMLTYIATDSYREMPFNQFARNRD